MGKEEVSSGAEGCAVILMGVAVVILVAVVLAGCAHPDPAKLVTDFRRVANEALQTQSVALPTCDNGNGQAYAYVLCPGPTGRHFSGQYIRLNSCLPVEHAGYAPRSSTGSPFLRAE